MFLFIFTHPKTQTFQTRMSHKLGFCCGTHPKTKVSVCGTHMTPRLIHVAPKLSLDLGNLCGTHKLPSPNRNTTIPPLGLHTITIAPF